MASKVKGKPKAKAKAKAKAKPKAKAKAKPEAKVKLRPDGLREGSAGGVLVDAVCKQAGATHAELCELVGWKQCLPFLIKSAKQAKVTLGKAREEGGRVRYFGTRASV
jgi:hypothetical protein